MARDAFKIPAAPGCQSGNNTYSGKTTAMTKVDMGSRKKIFPEKRPKNSYNHSNKHLKKRKRKCHYGGSDDDDSSSISDTTSED